MLIVKATFGRPYLIYDDYVYGEFKEDIHPDEDSDDERPPRGNSPRYRV